MFDTSRENFRLFKFFEYKTIDSNVKLQPIVIEKHGSINVVRDDLISGGTKRRFIYKFLYKYVTKLQFKQ